MRLICVAIALAATACGPFGGTPGPAPGAAAARGPSAAPPQPAGPAAALLQLAASGTYTVSLVFSDGQVVGPAAARLRTVTPAALPVFSTSDTRLYYLDGDNVVRFLDRDGSRGTVTRVPGGAHAQSGFAVSPDDQRIAVAAVDSSSTPAVTHLYVEDVAGGTGHVDLSLPAGARAWPVGWHAGQVVLAMGSEPTQSVAANPSGTFAGYEVVDATTGARLEALACDAAGPLTAAGTACLGGGTQLSVLDFAGRTRVPGGVAEAVVSAAEAPDGARVAFCCTSGQLQLWDIEADSVTDLGPADSPAYGWIDATHLLISDDLTQHPRVLDVTTGTSVPVAASPGRVVARVPGEL